MKRSLLYSGLLLATFLRTVANQTVTVTTPLTFTKSVPKTETSSGVSGINQTSGTDGTSSNANTIKEAGEDSLKTSATTAPTSTVKTASPDREPCDCLLDLRNNKILLILGGLILGCVILLIITIALASQVCHLKRHVHGYEPYHIETSTANGKRRGDEDHEPNEKTIMMSEVRTDNETTRDTAENNKCKETKEERDANTGAGADAVESDKPAASGAADGDKSAASEAKPPESSAEAATKITATAEDKDVTDGTKNEKKEETAETTETTQASAEAATA